jgi:putative transposase
MWGTDGVRIATVDDGIVWIFSSVDHCDGMCTGIHAAKIGDRFAALEPISHALLGEFGSVVADAGRGLSLKNGSRLAKRLGGLSRSDQVPGHHADLRLRRRTPERWRRRAVRRTMKEQVIHGRIFKNLEEVRAAAIAFRDRYHRDRCLEKLGFQSPL